MIGKKVYVIHFKQYGKSRKMKISYNADYRAAAAWFQSNGPVDSILESIVEFDLVNEDIVTHTFQKPIQSQP